jgi:adenylate cyclase
MIEEFCDERIIKKTRHVVEFGEKKWEVDVFEGDNDGLVIAELEVESEDEKFEVPSWCVLDVSKDDKYSNASLTEHPFRSWDVIEYWNDAANSMGARRASLDEAMNIGKREDN